MEIELDYAKSGVTPGAADLKVYDRETGERLFNVVEANALEGWYDQIVTKMGVKQLDPNAPVENGRRRFLLERIHRPLRIVRLVQSDSERQSILAAAEAKRQRREARQAKGMVHRG